MANLTPEQLQQYEEHCYFDVIGGETGHRYRIRHGKVMNIDELDANGSRISKRCLFPVGDLVVGDVMLAQKIALELFEMEALAIANMFPSMRLDSIFAYSRSTRDDHALQQESYQ